MRPLILAVLTALIAGFNLVPQAFAQPAMEAASPAPQIVWEVRNRFRLFRNEADFQKQVAAYRDADDCVAEIAALLADDARRAQIAASGQARAKSSAVQIGHTMS